MVKEVRCFVCGKVCEPKKEQTDTYGNYYCDFCWSFRTYVLKNIFHWFSNESLEKLFDGATPKEAVKSGTTYSHLFMMEMFGFIESDKEKDIVRLTDEGKRAIIISYILLRKDIEKELKEIKKIADKAACQILREKSQFSGGLKNERI